MRAAICAGYAIAAALAGGGCFVSWGGVQAAKAHRILDEGGREVSVPRPGVEEMLVVELPLAGAPALACTTTQRGQDTVYRTAFRYGRTWKRVAATMFVVEAALAAGIYFADRDHRNNQLGAGLLALDAVGTAALALVPRKEVFRTEVRASVQPVRNDCPDGLVLDIGGESFPVDAAGGLGDLGAAALEAWMRAPAAPLRVLLDGHIADLRVGAAELCVWERNHPADPPADPPAAPAPAPSGATCSTSGLPPRTAFASLVVPMGTLTRVDE